MSGAVGRARNPRRVVLAELRVINRWMRRAVGQWDQRGTVYDGTVAEARPDGGQNVRSVWRKLEPHERVENDPRAWVELEAAMREVSRRATAVAEYAVQEYEAARAHVAAARQSGTVSDPNKEER